MKKLFAFLGLALLAIPMVVFALNYSENGMLSAGDVITGNYYAAGHTTQILGDIQGDLLIAGGNVTVIGNVRDDVMAAGGTVTILGTVGGDVRVAGGNVQVNSRVNGEVIAFGGLVTLGDNANIGKDLVVKAGAFERSEQAVIGGEEMITVDAKTGDAMPDKDWSKMGKQVSMFLTIAFWIALIAAIIGNLIVGAIIFGLFKKPVEKMVSDVWMKKNNFWICLLIGAIAILLTPLVAAFALSTAIGINLFLLLMALYVVLFLLSMTFAGIMAGGLLQKLIQKPKKLSISWLYLLLGIVAVHLVVAIPYIGFLIGLFFFLIAAGAMLQHKWVTTR